MYRGRHNRRRGACAGARGYCGEPGLTRTVSLLVPGLAADFGGYAAAALPAAPALSLWLARGTVTDFSATWCEQAIAQLCGYNSAQMPPVAAISYREDFGTPPPGWCLRADPVHLRTDTSGLILFDASSFPLAADEAQALTDTLTAHLTEDNLRLVCRHPRRWYLLCDRPQRLATQPLPAVRGTRVSAMPYGGEDAAPWMGRINELQMLMHSHPVNRDRAERGEPAVNSVWLWGGGDAQPPHNPSCTRLAGGNLFARGIARQSGVPITDLPENASILSDTSVDSENLLVILEACRDAAAYEDIAVWQTALERLERDWFAPLLKALKQRRIDSLKLYALNGRCYRLTRRQLLTFWKGAGEYRTQAAFRLPSANRV